LLDGESLSKRHRTTSPGPFGSEVGPHASAILLAGAEPSPWPIWWGDYPQTVESYLRHHRHCAGDRASLFRTALCLWSRPVVGFLHLAPLS